MNGVYEAVRRIVGEEVEGNLESLAMADADTPVFTAATIAEIVELFLGGRDKEELIVSGNTNCGTHAGEPASVANKKSNARAAATIDLMLCLNELELAFLATDGTHNVYT